VSSYNAGLTYQIGQNDRADKEQRLEQQTQHMSDLDEVQIGGGAQCQHQAGLEQLLQAEVQRKGGA